MAFSKIILNGTTLMDVTGDTVDSSNLLSGYTATGADGNAVTGAYVPSGGVTDVTNQITFVYGSNVDFHLYTDGTYVFGYGHMAMVDDGRGRGKLEITLPFYANVYHPIPGSAGVAYDSNVNQITMTYANGVLTNYLFIICGEIAS